MKLANMVDLGSAGSNTLQVQVLPIVVLALRYGINPTWGLRVIIFIAARKILAYHTTKF